MPFLPLQPIQLSPPLYIPPNQSHNPKPYGNPTGQEMYQVEEEEEEETDAISTTKAKRTTTSRDQDDLPSSPASPGCWSCFPCLDGARERGIQLSMKIREKSELIAGPKWKTFIRRFNRSASGQHNRRQGEGRFQYDPLSYSLNFEEQNGGEEDEDAVAGFRNFSARFAPVPGSGKPAGEVSVYG